MSSADRAAVACSFRCRVRIDTIDGETKEKMTHWHAPAVVNFHLSNDAKVFESMTIARLNWSELTGGWRSSCTTCRLTFDHSTKCNCAGRGTVDDGTHTRQQAGLAMGHQLKDLQTYCGLFICSQAKRVNTRFK